METAWVKAVGSGWVGYTTQFSNKGPLVAIYSARETEGPQICRLQVDVSTGKIRLLHDSDYKVEVVKV